MIEFLRNEVWAHLPKKVKRRDRVIAAVLWPVGLAVIAAILYFWRHRIGLTVYAGLNVAAVLLAGALAVPGLGDRVYLNALRFFAIFGYFIGRIILTIAFYLGVTPLAFMMRLMGKKLLDPDFKGKTPPAWKTHKTSTDASDFYKQF